MSAQHGAGNTGTWGSAQSISIGAPPAREDTALEVQVNALRSLNESLGAIASRSEKAADRLLGCEPTPIRGDAEKQPAEPPLVARIEQEIRIAVQLTEAIHRSMNRLERL